MAIVERATQTATAAVAEARRRIAARGPTSGCRTLTIRADVPTLETRWHERATREALQHELGVEVTEMRITTKPGPAEWGTEVTLEAEIAQPLPELAADVVAAKLVRRFKALIETGEIPTTARNPAARRDAGEGPAEEER